MNFREQIWCVVSEEMCYLKLLPPYGPMLRKTKQSGKNSKLEFSQFFEQLRGRDP